MNFVSLRSTVTVSDMLTVKCCVNNDGRGPRKKALVHTLHLIYHTNHKNGRREKNYKGIFKAECPDFHVNTYCLN